MATPSQSPEAKELALIEKVEFRIALASDDAKLESILNIYLCPLLLKLASEHVSVRNKVISICQHINTRIGSQAVKLPVPALLKQFKDHPYNSLIRHFDLLYIQQNFTKLSQSERADLLPIVISGIVASSSGSALHSATLFNLFLRLLPSYKLPFKGLKEDDELRSTLNVTDEDALFLSEWLAKLFLFRSGPSSSSDTSATATAAPGLTADETSFLSLQGKPGVWDPTTSTGLNLTDTKVNCLKLLSSGLFNDNERFFPALFASSDPNSRLADVGEDQLKRALNHINLEDATIINRLFHIYLGINANTDGQNVKVPRVRVPVQIKVLSVLSRSKESLSDPERVAEVVRKDLVQDPLTHVGEGRLDREVMKLRAAIMSFVTYAARQGSLGTVSSSLIAALRDFLDQDSTNSRSLESKSIRGKGFEAVGILATSNTTALGDRSEIVLLRWLFRSLKEEQDRDVVVSIDEAIGSTIGLLQRNTSPDTLDDLHSLLLENMGLESARNLRNLLFASVRIANRCLPFNDVIARWIDILAISDGTKHSHEIVEEGKKGLDAHAHALLLDSVSSFTTTETKPLEFPDTGALIEYMFLDRDETQHDTDISALAVSFCRQTLIYESLKANDIQIDINSEWERKLEVAATEDAASRSAIRSHLRSMMKEQRTSSGIIQLWQAALRGMKVDNARSKASFAGFTLELCSLGPSSLLQRIANSFRQLEPAILSNDTEVRTVSAHSYGLLCAQSTVDDVQYKSSSDALHSIATTWKEAVGAKVNAAHGAMVGLAYGSSRRLFLRSDDTASTEVVKQCLPLFVEVLNQSRESLLQEGAALAIGQLCLYSAITRDAVKEICSLTDLFSKLGERAKAGSSKAIAALGAVSLLLDEDTDSSDLQDLTDKIYSLHDIRQAETQFGIGEALCCLACGWESRALANGFDVDHTLPAGTARQKTLSAVLDRALTDSSQTTKPALKTATVIWLLCFLEFCGQRPEIQERLPRFQRSFKRCLSDRDELVQESAARGLGLVYEKGPRELKDDLVRDLVGTFSSDKADISGTVTGDTQLFDAGALPTGEGSVQTYKDVMSLASEVGDPSLVYRFMSLASHNAIWSSRAAFGRFGLSNVFADSNVNEYLSQNPKMYPKLYRYRFDPNSNVRRSMNDIWAALVKDSTATVDANFVAIIEDLLSTMTGREWRARQASCAALADLVQGRKMEQLQVYLERLWKNAFLLCDDIKDSVRKAAMELTRVLTNMLIRNLEATEGSSSIAEDSLRLVIPFLLSTSGLEAKAEEVRALSLHTVLEVIKKGKARTLRPFIPELVERLLGLLSTLESDVVNYVYLNADKYKLKEHEIDELRLKSIRSSPIMEAIERCLDVLDEETMREVVQRLQEVIKSAVGMPTKAGCSRVLVSLSMRKGGLLRPYAGALLQAVQKKLVDRNETVSSSYAAALGYLARGATNEQTVKLIEFAQELYFAAEEERHRMNAGEAVQAVAKHAPERFAAVAAAALPFVFFAKHDEAEGVKRVFDEVWSDNVGGPRAISLYVGEIVALAGAHLHSARWSVKHAAARAIAAAAAGIGESSGTIEERACAQLWPGLQVALGEKTWAGKGAVVLAYATFVERAGERWRGSHSAEIAQISLREARRRNREYQPDALEALGRVAAAMADGGLAGDTVALARGAIDADSDAEEKGQGKGTAEDDSEEGASRRQRAAITAAFDSLAPGAPGEHAPAVLDLALSLATRAATHATVLAALFGACQRCLQRLRRPDSAAAAAPAASLLGQFERLLLAPLPAPQAERVLLARADAVIALAELLRAADAPPAHWLPLVDAAIDAHRSPSVRAALAKARLILLRA